MIASAGNRPMEAKVSLHDKYKGTVSFLLRHHEAVDVESSSLNETLARVRNDHSGLPLRRTFAVS